MSTNMRVVQMPSSVTGSGIEGYVSSLVDMNQGILSILCFSISRKA